MCKKTIVLTAVLILIISSFSAADDDKSWLPPAAIELNDDYSIESNPCRDLTSAPRIHNGTDELVIEEFGAYTQTWSPLTNASRGNVFYVDSTVNLFEHSFHLNISGAATPLCFFVYQGAAYPGAFTLVDSVTIDNQGPGEQFYASGERNYEMVQGYYYFIGPAWQGSAGYGRGGPNPPVYCSFGYHHSGIGTSGTTYPVTPTIANLSYISVPAYHQIITTGSPSGLSVSLTPHNPPIQIPAGGGIFSFDAAVQNTSDSAIVFDAWTMVILPNGAAYGPIIRRDRLTIPAGAVILRTLNQNVPMIAPAGNYTYKGYAGVYPDSIVAEDEFQFSKLAGEALSGNPVNSWICSGWDDDTDAPLILNSQFLILNSSPNPFNAETALNFKLQTACYVYLTIYDISGREVVVLAEGFYGAGYHQVEWDASSMASGVYFARLEAGDAVQTQKLLLVK